MTLDEIAAVTEGTLVNADPAAVVTGAVEYDSRRIGPGGLFLAFEGEKVDGHDYAAAAVAAGAAGVLSTRDTGQPGVVVADPLRAVACLARGGIGRLPQLTVAGLAGSARKSPPQAHPGPLLGRAPP